jgi:hypothetical protein
MSAKLSSVSAWMSLKAREKLVDQQKVPPVGFGPAERLRKEAVCVRICNAEGENGKEVHAIMRSGPGGFGDGYESSGTLPVILATILLTEWDAIPERRRGFLTAAYLANETSIFSQLADALMIFECHDGRAPQDLFRNTLGGFLALDTNVKAVESADTDEVTKLDETKKRLPWFVES